MENLEPPVQFPFFISVQFHFGDICDFFPPDAFVEPDQRGKRCKYLSPVQPRHSRVSPAEQITIMNRSVEENDVTVPGHDSGGRSRDRVGLHDIRPPSIVLKLHFMPTNLLAALDSGRAFQHVFPLDQRLRCTVFAPDLQQCTL